MSRKLLRINLLLLGKKSTQKQLNNFLKENHQPFCTFFNFTSDAQSKNHHLSPNSHWTITAAASPRIYETNITWTTPYHTKTTRDHEDDGIMETIQQHDRRGF